MPEPQNHTAHGTAAECAIGVFDSGVGGLSVLRELQRELSHEHFVYVSDAGHAPYGEKDDSVVLERSSCIAQYLCERHHIKALVVACNTATAAAIGTLRTSYPVLPLVGIEPAIKPALASSQTGYVGVMATRGTLASQKFKALVASLQHTGHLVVQACDGLADAIERNDATKIEALCAEYTRAMGPFGTQTSQIDTLVLGCTHYPFAQDVLRRFTAQEVRFLEGGAPVARHTRKLLDAAGLLSQRTDAGQTQFLTTGQPAPMAQAIERWLHVAAPVGRLATQQTA